MTETTCIRRAHSYWTTCPCAPCAKDRARKRKIQYVGMAYRVPDETAWRILAAKIDEGWTARALGSATGLDKPDAANNHLYFSRHVAQHRRGKRVHLGPAVAIAIMRMGRPTEGQVGAEPSRRRLRALAVIGHGLNSLATETGVQFSTLAMIRNTNERVGAKVANAIADTYDRLHMTPGDDEQAARIAREKGWAPPLAWENIDDIRERPFGWQRSFAIDRAEELREFDDRGAGISEVCQRLNIERRSLEKWCDRHDMTPLYSRLVDREQMRYWRNGGAEGGVA